MSTSSGAGSTEPGRSGSIATRPRYEPILTPDESWMVFDLVAGGPAEVDGRSLVGLPAAECGELVRRLNRQAGAVPEQEEQEPWKS